MEQFNSMPKHEGALETPSILLAGFLDNEAESIVATFAKVGWDTTVLTKEVEIEAIFHSTFFDFIVIDAEHLEMYAPHFVKRIRSTQGPSRNTTILVVDSSSFTGFREQFDSAGADLVVDKKADPRLLLSDLGQAAALRKQRSDANTSKHQSAVDTLINQLVNDQLEDVVSSFEFPSVVYFGSKIMILNNREKLMTYLSLYRSILLEEGLARIESRVTEAECAGRGPFKIVVENRYFATGDTDIGKARICYCGNTDGNTHKIRMVEYLEWPCAERLAECEPFQRMIA